MLRQLRSARAIPLGRRWLSSAAPQTKTVLDELERRGFVAAVTSPDLAAHLASPSCVYAGVDPSASSLHVGNLLPLLGLLHFRACGHRAIALIGGATGSIGDPSGRSTERNALSPEELAVNVSGITSQVERFFDRGITYAGKRGYGEGPTGSKEVTVVNNYDWFKDISFLGFLRDVGKLARVNTMLARDSVKSRLNSDQGISFTEFSYQLLQAHDFATLFRTHACRVQLGGSDQWGNIVSGIDMIKREQAAAARETEADKKKAKGVTEAQRDPAFGLTMPLLTTSSGEKFGKSAGNAVWLDQNRTSVFDFYQFFVRTPDDDVAKYLLILTLVPPAEIANVMEAHAANPKARAPQKLLAREVTELVHGPEGVRRAELITEVLFKRDLRHLSAADFADALEGDSRFCRVSHKDITNVPVSKLAVTYGLVSSRAEASRLIKPRNSGMFINDQPVTDPRRLISRSDLIDGHIAVLKRGSKDTFVLYVD